MLTEDQKDKFKDWLINNLQITSVSNVELIIRHVDHYYSPKSAIEEQDREKDAIEKMADNAFAASEAIGYYGEATTYELYNICKNRPQ